MRKQLNVGGEDWKLKSKESNHSWSQSNNSISNEEK